MTPPCRAVRQTTLGRIAQLLQSWGSGESGQIAGEGSKDIDKYNAMHDDKKTSAEGRNAAYVDLVNSYYNLATDFYEWGWGQSFHAEQRGQTFTSRLRGTSIRVAARRAAERQRSGLWLWNWRPASQPRPLHRSEDYRRYA